MKDYTHQHKNNSFPSQQDAIKNSTQSPEDHRIVEVDELLKDLIPDFMSRRFQELDQMEQWFEEKDFEALAHYGHKLKGSSLNYGFKYLGSLATGLETAAHNHNIQELRQYINEIKDHTQNVQIVYTT